MKYSKIKKSLFNFKAHCSPNRRSLTDNRSLYFYLIILITISSIGCARKVNDNKTKIHPNTKRNSSENIKDKISDSSNYLSDSENLERKLGTFTLSCGSGCAMTYKPINVICNKNTIKLEFNVLTYINQKIENIDTLIYFISLSDNKLLDDITTSKGESIYENLLPSNQNIFEKWSKNLIALLYKPKPEFQNQIITTYTSDFNNDEITDSILVYKNNSYNSKFENEHFGLTLQIVVSQENDHYKRISNSNLIFPFDNTCTSEGFTDIKFKNNRFTIEGQSCREHWILINYFVSFIYKNGNFILDSYKETYFDRVNHNRKIPSKIWTNKTFHHLTFDEVEYPMLIKWSNKYLNQYKKEKQ